MKITTSLFGVAVLILLAACGEIPADVTENLGKVSITEHRTPFGLVGRRECHFRVKVAGKELTFTASLTQTELMNKCKAMKNGDSIEVTKKFKKFKDGRETEIRYFGKVNEMMFPLT